jgi:hypothetical protein
MHANNRKEPAKNRKEPAKNRKKPANYCKSLQISVLTFLHYNTLQYTDAANHGKLEANHGKKEPKSGDAVHTCMYCLSCSGAYLNLLTHLQKKDTVHLHVLEGITQTVVIGSATNATKEVVTRTILANLTCSGGNYNQCTACNSGSFLHHLNEYLPTLLQ